MESSGATPPGGLSAAAVPDIAALFDAPGPHVTVYLGTEAAVAQAAQQNEMRWKALRKELEAAAAPETALEAIDPLIAEAHRDGRTLAVVANGSGALLVRHEPEPPARDVGRVANLPSVGPLLEWTQSAVPHVAVLADRAGADIVAFTRHGDPEVTSAGMTSSDDPELRKAHPGGWSQRRYQNRAENLWDDNAKEVADRVTEVVDSIRARLVVVAGDVRALEKLRGHLPERIGALIREVEGARAADGGVDELADDIVKLVATTAAEETVTVLAESRVDTLLIHDDPDDGRRAWFGPAAGMVATQPQTLRDMGVDDPEEGRLVDVAIRGALGTGAAVRVIPSVHSVKDGIGAILRF